MSVSESPIVCVGFAEWDAELWTNQQHLMSRLARRRPVLFVESLGLRKPTVSGRDIRRIGKRLVRGLAPPRRRGDVKVLAPLVLPFHANPVARRVNARLLPALVRRAAREQGARPILWGYVPQAEVLIDALQPARIVYHCVDDMAAQKGIDATTFRAAEGRFAARADLVLASAPALAERMRMLSEHVVYAPNVADTAAFAAALDRSGPVDSALAKLPGPRIVFCGAIVQTKLDFALIEGLARARPDWSIALVGPIGPGDPSTDVAPLRACPNIALLGPRSYADLPSVLRGADAAIIPYAINELTRSIFPMKVYEYLAAGLPVVATELPAIQGVEDVAFAADVDALVEALANELAGDSDAARAGRSERAQANSWDARVDEIERLLEAL